MVSFSKNQYHAMETEQTSLIGILFIQYLLFSYANTLITYGVTNAKNIRSDFLLYNNYYL